MGGKSKPRSRRLLVAIATGGTAVGVLAAAPAAQVNASTGRVPATATVTHFVSFQSFLRATADARYRSFVAAGRTELAAGAQAFGQMRSYILATYRGAIVKHSFVLGGSYFDCVTLRSQPAVREQHIRSIATQPAAVPRHPAAIRIAAGRVARPEASPLAAGRKDRFGNAISCPAGTIPMQRITLAEVTRFPTLAAFFAKGPDGARGHLPTTPASDGGHRYAVGYQWVNNGGGNSFNNLWDPQGDFSISQQWWVSATGTTQTVEGGWIHYPDAFGYNSVLFTYWTADTYATTGCYNLDCGAFVQVNGSVPLGASFSTYSTLGGTQVGFYMYWEFYQGNWWMAYNGTWVGYYPGYIYGSGPLASGNANLTEFGGETDAFGNDAWPQMGSGGFAGGGWSRAAFQSDIYYLTPSAAYWSSLSPIVTNPECYTLGSLNPDTNMYFGGPGGFTSACR